MNVGVVCHCGHRFAASPEQAGGTVNCPACGWPVEVPAAPPAAADGMLNKRCEYCHEYVPRWLYDGHVQQHMQLRPDGQQNEYATLPPERRDATNFANAPRWYRHQKCGAVTGMPEEIIQTYLADPWFYLSDRTFCTGCHRHVRQRECVWEETGEDLQTYTERLRAAKPELRPGILRRALAAVVNGLFG